MPKYAVVVTFSYDAQVSVLLFNTREEALEFIKKDIVEEYELDIEFGRPSQYVISEDEGRAVLKTGYDTGVENTEWRIGTVFDHKEVANGN